VRSGICRAIASELPDIDYFKEDDFGVFTDMVLEFKAANYLSIETLDRVLGLFPDSITLLGISSEGLFFFRVYCPEGSSDVSVNS